MKLSIAQYTSLSEQNKLNYHWLSCNKCKDFPNDYYCTHCNDERGHYILN